MPSIRSKVRSTMDIQMLSPSPPVVCAGAVCLLIITTTFVAASRHLSSLPISLGSSPRCHRLLSAPPRGPRSGHALDQTGAKAQHHGGNPAWLLRDVLSLHGVWGVVPDRCWLGSSLPRCSGLVQESHGKEELVLCEVRYWVLGRHRGGERHVLPPGRVAGAQGHRTRPHDRQMRTGDYCGHARVEVDPSSSSRDATSAPHLHRARTREHGQPPLDSGRAPALSDCATVARP